MKKDLYNVCYVQSIGGVIWYMKQFLYPWTLKVTFYWPLFWWLIAFSGSFNFINILGNEWRCSRFIKIYGLERLILIMQMPYSYPLSFVNFIPVLKVNIDIQIFNQKCQDYVIYWQFSTDLICKLQKVLVPFHIDYNL